MIPLALVAACIVLQPAKVGERLRAVSPDELRANVEALSNFGTRHTLSDTTSPTRGIGAAREWIKTRFESYNPPGGSLRVEFEELKVPPGIRVPNGATVVNVVATLPGTRPESVRRLYYIVGHYDSRNHEALDASGDAPGANDDASGTAAVLEAARVLAAHPLESTIVFLCTAGEEQGLLGAKGHAENLAARNGPRVWGVLSNDIVGDPLGELAIPAARVMAKKHAGKPLTAEEDELVASAKEARRVVRVFSEGLPRTSDPQALSRIRSNSAEYDSPSRQIARYIASIAELERTDVQPRIIYRPDRFLRGGDHSAFNEAGFAGVRFTVPHEDYSRQHVGVTERDGVPYGDLASFVDAEYLAGVTRLNLAALIHMANAPSTPANARINTKQLETGTTIRWERSPETDTAGYEVVWRDTTDWQWRHVKDAGNSTELILPLSKDNVFFGVRAYDTDGFRSPVAFTMDSRE